eukprot:SAG11_NODE_1740_length_4338_cov_2.608634_2_plen_231_part_00
MDCTGRRSDGAGCSAVTRPALLPRVLLRTSRASTMQCGARHLHLVAKWRVLQLQRRIASRCLRRYEACKMRCSDYNYLDPYNLPPLHPRAVRTDEPPPVRRLDARGTRGYGGTDVSLLHIRRKTWLSRLVIRLLDPEDHHATVQRLMHAAPPAPRYVRVCKYWCRFTTPAERAKSGWWVRRESAADVHFGPVSLRDFDAAFGASDSLFRPPEPQQLARRLVWWRTYFCVS